METRTQLLTLFWIYFKLYIRTSLCSLHKTLAVSSVFHIFVFLFIFYKLCLKGIVKLYDFVLFCLYKRRYKNILIFTINFYSCCACTMLRERSKRIVDSSEERVRFDFFRIMLGLLAFFFTVYYYLNFPGNLFVDTEVYLNGLLNNNLLEFMLGCIVFS